MSRPLLTDKQYRALTASASPGSLMAHIFWDEARANWIGFRRTLGSLHARGLIDYKHDRDPRWKVTEDGLTSLESERSRRGVR